MDKMTRATAAQRIIEDEVYKEAVASVRSGIIEQMVSPSVTDEKVIEQKRLLLALGQIENRLKSYIVTGQIEERKRDRASDR